MDNLVNTTSQVQSVSYTFRYRLNDNRVGSVPWCDHGIDTTLTIYVNPTPRFTVEVVGDTLVCDSSTVTLDVTDLLGTVYGDKVYDLTTNYTPGALLGVQDDGEYPIATDVVDDLVNTTNHVQSVSYTFR